jgi:hypothetical protein
MQGSLFAPPEACPFCKRAGSTHTPGCIREPSRPQTFKMHHANDPDTSRQAAQAIAPHINSIQAEVLRWFQEHRSATDEDLEKGLGDTYPGFSTLRKRRGELVDKGFLRDSGKQKENSRGRNMVVWELV